MKAYTVLAGLVAVASAITIKQPTQGTAWDFSQTNTIEWSSVSTDTTSFKIILVDHSKTPASEQTIKDTVNTSDGKYAFSNFVAAPGSKYSVEFIGTTTSSSGLLAESQQFNVTKSGVAATTTASTPVSPTDSSAPGASTTAAKNGAAGKTFGATGLLAVAFAMLL